MIKNSQLIGLFAALTKEELRELSKWLDSPFHNQRADVVLLFQYLKKHLHNEHKLLPNIIWENIAPNVAYDNKLLRYTMSFLLQQLLDFLAYRQWARDPLAQNLALEPLPKQ